MGDVNKYRFFFIFENFPSSSFFVIWDTLLGLRNLSYSNNVNVDLVSTQISTFLKIRTYSVTLIFNQITYLKKSRNETTFGFCDAAYLFLFLGTCFFLYRLHHPGEASTNTKRLKTIPCHNYSRYNESLFQTSKLIYLRILSNFQMTLGCEGHNKSRDHCANSFHTFIR